MLRNVAMHSHVWNSPGKDTGVTPEIIVTVLETIHTRKLRPEEKDRPVKERHMFLIPLMAVISNIQCPLKPLKLGNLLTRGCLDILLCHAGLSLPPHPLSKARQLHPLPPWAAPHKSPWQS